MVGWMFLFVTVGCLLGRCWTLWNYGSFWNLRPLFCWCKGVKTKSWQRVVCKWPKHKQGKDEINKSRKSECRAVLVQRKLYSGHVVLPNVGEDKNPSPKMCTHPASVCHKIKVHVTLLLWFLFLTCVASYFLQMVCKFPLGLGLPLIWMIALFHPCLCSKESAWP